MKPQPPAPHRAPRRLHGWRRAAIVATVALAAAVAAYALQAQRGGSSAESPATPAASTLRIALSAEERRYLEGLGPLTVAPDPDWLPFEYFDEHGNFSGITADLLDLIAARLDIRFSYVVPRDWEEALAMSRAGEVLILPFLNQTPEREQWLVFTDALLIEPNVFITREEHPYITAPAQLSERSIVLPTGTSMEERVRRDFPNLRVLTVPTENEVFHAVSRREADMTLRSLTVAAYTIRKEGLFTLKIAGQAPADYTNHLRMGVLRSEPMLRDILDKAIASISAREREEIINRHVNIRIVQPVDYGPLLRIAGVLLLLTALSYYWSYRLRRINTVLSESQSRLQAEIAERTRLAHDLELTSERLLQALQEEKKANVAQHQFLRMIGHEFRTPLSVVQSTMDLLELAGKLDGEDGQRIRERHQEAVGRIAGLIDNALRLDRFEGAKWRANAEPLDIAALLEKVADYARRTDTRGHHIEVWAEPAVVHGDRELLDICVHNLVDNALKYSPPGSPITLHAERSAAGNVAVRVCDRGPGIPAADRPWIFSKYYRREGQEVAGYGLGLYLVDHIVRLHGGTVDVAERADGGCCFTVSLPPAR